MQRSRSPASSCCTAFGRDSSNCDVSAFKIELHLQSGTQCFEPEPALRSKDCLLVLVICTRAEEMTKAVLGSSVLRAEAERYTLTGPLSEVSIPASLHESLVARLDRLPTVHEGAPIGAVLGREFAYEMLRAITAL